MKTKFRSTINEFIAYIDRIDISHVTHKCRKNSSEKNSRYKHKTKGGISVNCSHLTTYGKHIGTWIFYTKMAMS